MRTLLLILLLFINLIQMDLPEAEAATCGCRCSPGLCPGDAVIDVGKLIQFIKQYSQEILIHARFVNIDMSKAIIQVNTYKTMYEKTINRPLKDALSLVAINSSANQIISMVNGSVNGNSLLVANPEKFVKKAELNSVQASYNLVASENLFYSDNILKTIITETRKQNGDEELIALTHSEIPTAIQGSVCEDGALTDMAIYNVSENGNVEYTDAQVAAEKSSLYNAVCIGDPNNDPAIAQRLLALNDQVPSVGGWDTWLRKTGGDNPFSRTQRAVQLVKSKANEQGKLAEDELDKGAGIASEKICTKKDSTGLCTESAIVNPGSAIKEAYSKAKMSGLDTALKSFGTGVEGGELFSDLSDIFGLVGDAYENISSVTPLFGNLAGTGITDAELNAKRTGSLSVATTQTAPSAPPEQTFSDPSLDQDLTATQKNLILGYLKPVIQNHLNTFPALTLADTNYIAAVDTYLTKVNTLKKCFDDIQAYATLKNYPQYNLTTYEETTPFPTYTNGQTQPTMSSATWYSNEISQTSALKNQLLYDRDTFIPATSATLNQTLTNMEGATTLDEVLSFFNHYIDLLDTDQIVSIGSSEIRPTEQQIFQLEVDEKLLDDRSWYGTVGPYAKYKDRCDAIRLRVAAEIYTRDNPEAIFQFGGVDEAGNTFPLNPSVIGSFDEAGNFIPSVNSSVFDGY